MNNITDDKKNLNKGNQAGTVSPKIRANFLLKSNTSLLNNNNINKGAAKGILYSVFLKVIKQHPRVNCEHEAFLKLAVLMFKSFWNILIIFNNYISTKSCSEQDIRPS